MADNNRVFSDLLKEQVDKVIKPRLVTMLNEIAEWMVGVIDDKFQPFGYYGGGNKDFPIWYGQLHDSIGVGVYVDGRLQGYKPTAIGIEPQFYGRITNIVGAEYLDNALSMATTKFPKGIWIVLFSTVPYAYKVNVKGSPWGRGVNFFGRLKETIKSEVFLNLTTVGS